MLSLSRGPLPLRAIPSRVTSPDPGEDMAKAVGDRVPQGPTRVADLDGGM